jgi:hypothetical protein
MRCLYCGKELALLKRLTRGGEFCSDAHKQSYQEEYNRLGLSRLLQARSRADESRTAHRVPAPPAATVALVDEPVEDTAEQEVAPPLQQAPPVVIAAPPEPPPPAMAGFAMETPSISVRPEPVSYLEPCEADGHEPARAPAWHLEGPSLVHQLFTLPSAELLPLAVQPSVCQSSYTVMDTSVAARESGTPRVNLSVPLTIRSTHEFEWGGSLAIQVAPRPSESSSYSSLSGPLDFTFQAGLQVFELLDLAPAGIAYPSEECEVTVPESWTNGIISDAPVDITVPAIPYNVPAPELEPEPVAAGVQTPTPRSALEALSKLHQDMRERQEAKPAAPPDATLKESEAALKSLADPDESSPREANELLAISLKSFAPPKAAPVIDANALLANGHPVFPRLKSLPLRPKVGPTPSAFGREGQKSAQTRTAPAAEAKAKAEQTSAPAPTETKQKLPETDKPAQPSQPSKPPQTGGVPKPAQSQQTVQVAQPQQPVESKLTAQSAKQEQTVKSVPVKSVPVVAKAQPSQPPKPEPAATAQASSPITSAPVKKAPTVKEQPAGKAPPSNVAASPSASSDSGVPNFGAVVNTSMWGSLTAKLGIAALIVIAGVVGYFGFFNKSAKSSAPQARSGDGVGMSIMVGEGGWVEGWAGDPIGLHNGRQITIYRPSLKLSDYRMEFQGQIDTKSLGWVFRASDPENYYATKLELVSPELPLTVVLYKYMVLKGRQVQVGRVPIEVPVRSDTVFSIRVDVRGPKFTTYVQGQPVDVWTDDQIRSGGVGFINERSERGKIKSVSLSYLSGGTK